MSDQHLIQCCGGAQSSTPTSPVLPQHSDVNHSMELAQSIGSLFENDEFSDLTLIVEEVEFPVHRVVLAARSDYFRALLFGGMRESSAPEIVLKDVSATAFRYILMYVYTGMLSLADLKEETILDVLGLAHQYNFCQLESAVSEHLRDILNMENTCLVYNMAVLYNLDSLIESSLQFMDKNATTVLGQSNFLLLSASALEKLISRDSFCAPEVDIFHAVRRWLAYEYREPGCDHVMSHIRLALMALDDLLYVVRTSGSVSPDTILDAIQVKTKSRHSELHHRGILIPDENLATPRHGATVIRGERKMDLLDGDFENYNCDRGFTRHAIDDAHGQIVIQLGAPSIINTLRLLLWDKDMRSYSYYVDVSLDESDWVRVVDHRAYLCRSWQTLHFEAKVVRYIRLVGTHNTFNKFFHVVGLEAYYSKEQFKLYKGLIIPRCNVATTKWSATVVEGVSRTRNALINGDTVNYDWDSGYTCHQLGNGAIVVQLTQPYYVGSMRFLLWDLDNRSYSYTVEVSTDQSHWQMVCDRSQDACRSWQTVNFQPRPVCFVRIVGTHNTANEVFHVVQFECPYDLDARPEDCQDPPPSDSPASSTQDDRASVKSAPAGS